MHVATNSEQDSVVAGGGTVRADALQNFPELVTSLGGNADALLAGASIDPSIFARHDRVVSYRAMVQLLERAASDLKCPDFGMRLAATQRGARSANLIELVMKNSRTVGEAFSYSAQYIQAYSDAVSIGLEDAGHRTFLRFEILLSRLPYQRQAIECTLLRTHQIASDISDGRARLPEIWFTHDALAPLATYRQHFGCIVRFGQPANGLFFNPGDFALPIYNADPQIYDLATHFIESQYPAQDLPMSTRARMLIARLLNSEECTSDHIAASLGLHRRTLHRRLRDEGTCFESIKDEVRRETALRCLSQSNVSLTRVAEMLGYSEVSALSRSCNRWFSVSPRQLRSELTNSWRASIAA